MAQYQIPLGDDVGQHLFVGDGGVARWWEQVGTQVLQAQAQEAVASTTASTPPCARSSTRRTGGGRPG
jgi:hypothetical protein